MSRPLLKLAFLVSLLLTITSLAARVLGSTQPPNPALRGFIEGCEDKPQPCWFGIVPGVTNIVLAQEQVESRGYDLYNFTSDNRYFSNQADHSDGIAKPGTCSNIRLSIDGISLKTSAIFLTGCDGVFLGDLTLVGLPEKILSASVKIGQYYTAEIVEYERVDQLYYHREWSPDTQVQSFDIGSSRFGRNIALNLVGYTWHGFLPHWRYCQLEPGYGDCAQ